MEVRPGGHYCLLLPAKSSESTHARTCYARCDHYCGDTCRHIYALDKGQFYVMSGPPGLKQPDNPTKYPLSALRCATAVTVLVIVLMAHGLSMARQDGAKFMSQEVTPHEDIVSQVTATEHAQDTFVSIETLAARETVQDRLRRLGMMEPALKRTLQNDAHARLLATLGTGATLQVAANRAGKLERLVADIHAKQIPARVAGVRQAGAQRILIERNERSGFTASKEFREHDVYWRHRVGTIENGFFSAMARADIPSHITAAVMRLFKDRIDFRHGFHKGDAFRIIYQSSLLDGAPTQNGQILAMEIQAKGKWHQALWHQEAAHQFTHAPPGTVPNESMAAGRYYAFNGTPLTGASTWVHPIGTTHVTSPFGLRTHPLRQHRHHHTGVDLAAKEGSPVKAAAGGTIEFMGWKRGYGKLIIVRHNARYSTYYAHLQGFSPTLRQGQSVAPGQRIGAVGQTGDVTGPHLHFEVRDRGTPINPMFALRPSVEPLSGPQLASFRTSSKVLIGHIERMRAIQDG